MDGGGSPDVFLGGVTRTALSDNQAAGGKVAALRCGAALVPCTAAACPRHLGGGIEDPRAAWSLTAWSLTSWR